MRIKDLFIALRSSFYGVILTSLLLGEESHSMKPHHFILAVVPDTGRLHTLHGISFYNQFFLLDTLIKDLNMCVLCPTEYTKLIY